MNHEEAANIAKKILEKDGYHNLKINSDLHVVGSNIRTIRATEGNVTVTLTMDDDTGVILDKKISKMYERHMEEQNIAITDSISVIPTYHSIRKYYSDNPKRASVQIALLFGGVAIGAVVGTFNWIDGIFAAVIIGSLSFCMPPFTKNQTIN